MGKHHESRRVLNDIKSGFVGWKTIQAIAEECKTTEYYAKSNNLFSDEQRQKMRSELQRRDMLLAVVLFLVGGRISEVLMLRKENFVIEDEFVYVKDAPLLKRHKRTFELLETKVTPPTKFEISEAKNERSEWKWEPNKQIFTKYKIKSEPIIMKREEFPIPIWEPLTDYLIERVEQTETWLFPSPYTGTRKETVGVEKWINQIFEIEGREWVSPQRAYQIIESASSRLGEFVATENVQAKGVWNHWFRSQRASQLARDYEFKEGHLNAFFGWVEPRDVGTSSRYTKVGVIGLEDQMLEKKARHDRLKKRDFRR